MAIERLEGADENGREICPAPADPGQTRGMAWGVPNVPAPLVPGQRTAAWGDQLSPARRLGTGCEWPHHVAHVRAQ